MQGLRGDRRTRFYIFSQGLTGWHLQGAALGWDGTKAGSEASQGSPSSSASKPGSHLGGDPSPHCRLLRLPTQSIGGLP